jgi:hypothetical protein
LITQQQIDDFVAVSALHFKKQLPIRKDARLVRGYWQWEVHRNGTTATAKVRHDAFIDSDLERVVGLILRAEDEALAEESSQTATASRDP